MSTRAYQKAPLLMSAHSREVVKRYIGHLWSAALGRAFSCPQRYEVCRGAHRLYVLAFPSPFPGWDMHCCLWLFQHLPRCCTKIRGPLSPISGSPILLAHKTGYVYGIAPSQAPQECTRQLKDASQGSRHTLACAACIHGFGSV